MNDYNALDVAEIAVAYHNLMKKQYEFLKIKPSDDFIKRKKAVETMRAEIQRYKKATNKEIRQVFLGRGINLKMLENLCEKLSVLNIKQ